MNVENSHPESPSLTGTEWVTWSGICALPIFFVFAFLGDLGKGMAGAGSAAMIVLAMRRFWDSRNRYWFWITVAGIALLHAGLILLIRLPDITHYAYIQLSPLAFVDLYLNYGVLKMAKRLFGEHSSAASQ